MVTINKRETSYEGLVQQFENGEDGIYGLISNDKHTIFRPKVCITQQDIEEVPGLKQLREAIELWEEKLKTAKGHDAYVIKKTLIDLRKDQYILKDSYRRPIVFTNLTRSRLLTKLPEEVKIDAKGNVSYSGISLLDPNIITIVLCNYSKLKETSEEDFESDTWYFMQDFDELCEHALIPHPLYRSLVIYKIDGRSNAEIQDLLQQEYGIRHSIEYLSVLWRNKIPRLIANTAKEEYLNWYYTYIEKGTYKRCSRCGEIKLAHNQFFSRNKTSKDKFYSICKECRNRKESQDGE